MGEMADYEMERQERLSTYGSAESFMPAMRYVTKPRKVYWVISTGTKIEIKNMTTSHIENSIVKCKRDGWRVEAIPYLQAELDKRN